MAPRALLVVGTENDPNCPLPGANIAYASAMQAYASKKLQKYGLPAMVADLMTKGIPKLERWKKEDV